MTNYSFGLVYTGGKFSPLLMLLGGWVLPNLVQVVKRDSSSRGSYVQVSSWVLGIKRCPSGQVSVQSIVWVILALNSRWKSDLFTEVWSGCRSSG